MKKLIMIAMILASGAAQAENINVSAGRCGAYHFVMSGNPSLPKWKQQEHLDKATLALRHRTNVGQQQVAANLWVELVNSDPKRAVEQALWSCIYHLKIR